MTQQFKVWDRVRIRKDSQYYYTGSNEALKKANPINTTGVVVSGSCFHVTVQWPKFRNGYSTTDLEQVGVFNSSEFNIENKRKEIL